MQTIKTVTVRLNAQEMDYVQLLQKRHKERYNVNLSQSDLFRMLLNEKAERVQLTQELADLKDSSFMERMRGIMSIKKGS